MQTWINIAAYSTLIFMVVTFLYFSYKAIFGALKLAEKVTLLPLELLGATKGPKGRAVTKGIVGLLCGYWALNRAHTCKSEKEKDIYLGLVEEAREMMSEANDELEGKEGSGKFYDNPDWWKKDGGDEPPKNPRWN